MSNLVRQSCFKVFSMATQILCDFSEIFLVALHIDYVDYILRLHII